MVRGTLFAALVCLPACLTERAPEDPMDWYQPAEGYDVQETIEFTDTPYGFPSAAEDSIADLPLPPEFTTWFAEDDPPPAGCGDWETDPGLPSTIHGMVTAHPRIYIKVSGCVPEDNFDADSDEKYYGSFFVQDSTGGVFVLGDSKVAHFTMGDRVTLDIRAVKNNFGLKMVAAHDVTEIQRGPEPIYYQTQTGDLGDEHVGKVVRVQGTVATGPDTFGEFQLHGDQGEIWSVGLDVELNRRGVQFPVGQRLQITAPVMYSYSTYTLVVMRLGQVTVLAD